MSESDSESNSSSASHSSSVSSGQQHSTAYEGHDGKNVVEKKKLKSRSEKDSKKFKENISKADAYEEKNNVSVKKHIDASAAKKKDESKRQNQSSSSSSSSSDSSSSSSSSSSDSSSEGEISSSDSGSSGSEVKRKQMKPKVDVSSKSQRTDETTERDKNKILVKSPHFSREKEKGDKLVTSNKNPEQIRKEVENEQTTEKLQTTAVNSTEKVLKTTQEQRDSEIPEVDVEAISKMKNSPSDKDLDASCSNVKKLRHSKSRSKSRSRSRSKSLNYNENRSVTPQNGESNRSARIRSHEPQRKRSSRSRSLSKEEQNSGRRYECKSLHSIDYERRKSRRSESLEKRREDRKMRHAEREEQEKIKRAKRDEESVERREKELGKPDGDKDKGKNSPSDKDLDANCSNVKKLCHSKSRSKSRSRSRSKSRSRSRSKSLNYNEKRSATPQNGERNRSPRIRSREPQRKRRSRSRSLSKEKQPSDRRYECKSSYSIDYERRKSRRSESLEKRRVERKKRHAEIEEQEKIKRAKRDEENVERREKELNKPDGDPDKVKELDNITVTDPNAKITERQRKTVDILTSRTGGAYIPPAKLRLMQAEITDKASAAYQRIAWEALKKSIHGYINKVNVDNIAIITREMLKENIVRGRGLLCRSIIQAQAASPTFTHVYAALVSIINSKFPNIGELLLKRLVIQFKRAFRRNDKAVCLSSSRFIAHLVNQRVAHEILALEILTLLVESPTDDSVEVAISFLKECGMKLTEVSSKGIGAIFEMLKNILHEGKLDKRVQYMIEVVFQVRKDGFKDHQSVIESLELVEEDDQFTHLLMLDDATNTEDMLNAFKFDEEYAVNEDKYKGLSKEILGSEDADSDGSSCGSESGSDSDSDDDEENEEKRTADEIIDNTETNLIALRRTIYLTINSSLDYEECAHKLMKMQLKPGQEIELCHMFLDCCAEQRTYEKFYGLLAQRFCSINKIYIEPFEEIFKDTFQTTHRLDTNRLRNVSKFFAHLLFTDAISWDVLECIKLNEDDTTSSSRIFIKILFQELAEYMGLSQLNKKLKDEVVIQSLAGLFPKDNPRNTRFSINFFTSIGLGGLTDELRQFLKNAPKSVPAINAEILANKPINTESPSSSSSSSSSASESSSQSSSSSSNSSSDSVSDSEVEKKKRKSKKKAKKSAFSSKNKEKEKKKKRKSNKGNKKRKKSKKSESFSTEEETESSSSSNESSTSESSSSDESIKRKSKKKDQNKKKAKSNKKSKKKNKSDSDDFVEPKESNRRKKEQNGYGLKKDIRELEHKENKMVNKDNKNNRSKQDEPQRRDSEVERRREEREKRHRKKEQTREIEQKRSRSKNRDRRNDPDRDNTGRRSRSCSPIRDRRDDCVAEDNKDHKSRSVSKNRDRRDDRAARDDRDHRSRSRDRRHNRVTKDDRDRRNRDYERDSDRRRERKRNEDRKSRSRSRECSNYVKSERDYDRSKARNTSKERG